MKILNVALIIIVFTVLTVLTQVGGLLYLLSFLTYAFIHKRFRNKIVQRILKLISFLTVYTFATFLLVPIIAKPFNRVPLAVMGNDKLNRLNFLTCFLNRHYVQPELKQALTEVAAEMNSAYPGTTVQYLDANFPFFNNFPLFPHLSHNDGKKLDIAFCYIDAKTKKSTNEAASFIGYGVSEEPGSNEINTAEYCAGRGYWQYSFLKKLIPQGNKGNFTFDNVRTKKLITLFMQQPAIEKIFIEPHLKMRLKLSGDKIRFQGCQAVRHDDHIHVQVR